MANPPILVEVSRGPAVESVHLVDVVVADPAGALRAAYGEPDRLVFPRSSIKALQALPFVESGVAARLGLEAKHIALACASHNGEEFHVAAATHMLRAAGQEPVCLECGAHPPLLDAERDRLVREGRKPEQLHNCCSGKHAGFVCYAVDAGYEVSGYVKFGHKLQRDIAGILEAVTGARHGPDNHGIDGCSIPSYAIPLRSLAWGFAKLAAGEGGGPQRSAALDMIRDACMAHPEMVAGTGRFETIAMQGLANRVFLKSGAEGMFTAAIPELGLGIAVKARDGADRAAQIAVANLVESLLEASESGLPENQASILKRLANPVLKNWNGIEVGESHRA